MTISLRQYINKTILVSIPSLFESAEARPCRLAALEMQGLWLVAEPLSARVLHQGERQASGGEIIFVPFAQIAAISLPPPEAKTALVPDAPKKARTAAKPRRPS